MPTNLLIHFISDFLRDPSLRCWVMENEDAAYTAHNLSTYQKGVLTKVRDGNLSRLQFLAEIEKELPKIRFEEGAGEVLQYPTGTVTIQDWKVLQSVGSNRTIGVVGIGFVSTVTITFTPPGGTPISAPNFIRSCDIDVWQRLTILVELPAGPYKMKIDRGDGVYAEKDITVP